MLILLAATVAPCFAQQTNPKPEPEHRVCDACPFPEGITGWMEGGVGYLGAEAFASPRHQGFDREGVYGMGNLDLRYWGKEKGHWELVGTDLGLDAHSLSIQGGRQGRYRLRIRYDALPSRALDGAMSPFLGAGGSILTLPPQWVAASSTAGMSALPDTLQRIPIAHERENLKAGITLEPTPHLQVSFDARHEKREGIRLRSGHFIAQSALLPEPIDTATDAIEAVVHYSQEKAQVRLAYYGSFFTNENRGLIWDNPFTPLAPGSDRGQAALPPDNQAHQIALSGSYRFSVDTRASGSLSLGRMEQNEDFLPYTLNPNIASAPLPAASAMAKVNTLRSSLHLQSRLNPQLRVNLTYQFEDRDNRTPTHAYDWIESDSFPAGTRSNRPYGFQKHEADLKGHYRISSLLQLSGGIGKTLLKRDLQERSRTDEDELWMLWAASDKKGAASGSLKVSYADREGEGGGPSEGAPGENPLLRKFNTADRNRISVDLQITVSPSDGTSLGFRSEAATENYARSELGLTDGNTLALMMDLSVLLPRKTRFYSFVSYETIASRQSGSQHFGRPDWQSHNKDAITTLGMGFFVPRFLGRYELGLDLSYAESKGEIEIKTAGGAPAPFPNLETAQTSASLYLNYRMTEQLAIKAAYTMDQFHIKDWALDGLAADTVSSVLTNEALRPDYKISFIGLTVSYNL